MVPDPAGPIPSPYTTLFRALPVAGDLHLHRRRHVGREAAVHGEPEPFARPELRARARRAPQLRDRSEEHTSELQSLRQLVCRLLLEKTDFTRWDCMLDVISA